LDAYVDGRVLKLPETRGERGGGGENRFLATDDGVLLHYLRWIDGATRPWAALIFLHGIASHAGWFRETAVHLELQGVAVYAPDRRGSGLSGGRPGHLDRYERALADIDEVTALVTSAHPTLPVFLAASSWSAKLALLYVGRPAVPLSGLLLLGPGLRPRVRVSLPERLEAVGRHFVTPTAAMRVPLTPEMYTANPKYLEFIRSDPLRQLTVTADFFWETARLDRHRRRASRRLRLPLLVQQGEDDGMMDVPATRRWFNGLTLADKTYHAYPGAGHTLDFEPDPSQYRDDIVAWLRARAGVPLPDTTVAS
jgi:alpha-beta hydrolase superfamily lysophospholipase